MRKLIVSMNITLDGFMAAPDCSLAWHFRYWTSEMADTLTAELYKTDCLLFGRKTYCGMMQHWQSKLADESLPRTDLAFFHGVNNCKKLVVSKTLQQADWKHSSIISKNVKQQIGRLKNSTGKNILVYGSGQLCQSLLSWKLADGLQLWVHPVLLGNGKAFFPSPLIRQANLCLQHSETFSSGVVLLNYSIT